MRILAVIISCLAMLGLARAEPPDHAAWDRLLQTYAAEGADGVTRVDYGRWRANRADRAALEGYIERLEAAHPSQLPVPDAFAFWANLYNALTVRVVLEAYPVDSIREIPSRGVLFNPFGGPWKMKLVSVEGRALSLDDIEHGIMRPTFRDPRVHYAVNCASIGCPNLAREAFRGERLEAQLEAAARAYVQSARGVSFGPRGLTLSSIYNWFAEDFGSTAELRAHLARYAAPARAARILSSPIVGYAYDWSLNDLVSEHP